MKKKINKDISLKYTQDDRSRDRSSDYVSVGDPKSKTITAKFEVQPARINHFTGEDI